MRGGKSTPNFLLRLFFLEVQECTCSFHRLLIFFLSRQDRESESDAISKSGQVSLSVSVVLPPEKVSFFLSSLSLCEPRKRGVASCFPCRVLVPDSLLLLPMNTD